MTKITRSFVAFLLLMPTLASGQETKVATKKSPRPSIDEGKADAKLQMLGVERVPGVRESGFYNTEGGVSSDPFRWTNGSARLVVPFDGPPPVALHVRLGLGVPKPTKLTIRVNGTSLFDETVKPQSEWSRNFDLRGAVTKGPVTIEILSDVFVPSKKDDRDLGVCVRGMTLINSIRDYAGVNLAPEPVPGVEEGGFHHRERSGDQPFRWTDGNAKVIVPVADGRRWRTLAVTAEIPERPDYRVRLTVNGRVLFDDVAKAGRTWAKEFPLDGIDLDRRAVIDVTSSTIPPGQTRTKDDRTLGIRLRELILRTDESPLKAGNSGK